MQVSISLMRNNSSDPYRWAVIVKPNHREPATIQSWHDSKKEAQAVVREMVSPVKNHRINSELFS